MLRQRLLAASASARSRRAAYHLPSSSCPAGPKENSTMKVGSGFGGGWLTEVAESARRAEELGYDFAGTPETGHDSMLAAALAANATERLEVQTSVTIAFPRSPTVLAMEAW